MVISYQSELIIRSDDPVMKRSAPSDPQPPRTHPRLPGVPRLHWQIPMMHEPTAHIAGIG